MTTQAQDFARNDKDYDKLVDHSIFLGRKCWRIYIRSKVEFVRFFMLPTDDCRRRAHELFQFGFSGRMIMCPTTGVPDTDTEEIMWESFLESMVGKIVLDGPAYPETPDVVLKYAKVFFLAGFHAGTIAAREIFNS